MKCNPPWKWQHWRGRLSSSMKCYPFVLETTGNGTVMRLKDLLAAIIQDVRVSRPTEMIAARFHKTIAEMSVDVCRRARRSTGLNEVALSGVSGKIRSCWTWFAKD